MIDLRSFSNLWYWIGLAVLWSTASHRVLGVPYDMVPRAARSGGQAAEDLRDAVRIKVNRITYVFDAMGGLIVAFMFFLNTVLLLLGFVYGVEFAQAVVLMLLPMNVVGLINLQAARVIRAVPHDDAALRQRLTRLRLTVQLIGIVSIFITGIWGTYQNLVIGVLR